MYYGWIIVWLTFVAILVVAGVRSISGLLIVPLETEFLWSRSGISFAFALNFMIYGLLGPFIAAAMDRVGVRKMTLWSMLLVVLCLIAVPFMTQLWQFNLIWGVAISLGSAVFLTVLSAFVANRWFEKRRGTVLGLLMAATAAGQMIFLPVLSGIMELYSWRMTMYIFIGLCLVLLPIIAVWMRDDPRDMGLLPYGADGGANRERTGENRGNPIASAFEGLWIGVKSGTFWLLAVSYFICGATTAGLIGTHFIPASAHHGIHEVQAAGIFAFMGIFNIIGTMFSGWLSDRFDNRWLLFWYYGLRGVSLFFLPLALERQSYMMLVLFAVFYGLDWIATVPPTVRLASEHFGKERGTIIYGWMFAAHQLGSGVAAFMGGWMYELQGSYTMAFVSAGILCIVATMFVISLRRMRAVQAPRPGLEA